MEEASKAKKAKKGFMTPERKKKLRVIDIYIIILKLRVCLSHLRVMREYVLNFVAVAYKTEYPIL